MTFQVSRPSADAPSRSHGPNLVPCSPADAPSTVAEGWGGNHAWGPAFVLTHHIPAGWPRPNSTVHFVTDGIESAVNQAKAAAAGKSVASPRRRHHPAVAECWPPRRNPRRHRGGASRLRSSTLRPPRRHASRPRQPDGDPGRRLRAAHWHVRSTSEWNEKPSSHAPSARAGRARSCPRTPASSSTTVPGAALDFDHARGIAASFAPLVAPRVPRNRPNWEKTGDLTLNPESASLAGATRP